MKKLLFALTLLLTLISCRKSPEIPAGDLGGGFIFDPSTYDPAKYLVSVSNPSPTAEEAQKPVIIACHGYSATTFEWDEFRNWSMDSTGYSISSVLLAGHGTTYADFEKSTWHDWQSSIAAEYDRLTAEGYKNIDFAASSTSCTLLLDMIRQGVFNRSGTIVHIFLVDPIVIPSDKSLSLIGVLGPMLGYVTASQNPGEEQYYYHYRPEKTLQQLQDCLNVVRVELQNGMTLPSNIDLKVYKSIRDPTADPVSAVLIYNGIKTNSGGKIDLQMVNSDLHVFTRLSLVPEVTALDRRNQLNAFHDIATRIFK